MPPARPPAITAPPTKAPLSRRNTGSFSLHHTLCVHRSAPNRATHRRVGLGINYIPAHVRPTAPFRMAAMLARGADKWGHFDLFDSPAIEFDATALANHERVYNPLC